MKHSNYPIIMIMNFEMKYAQITFIKELNSPQIFQPCRCLI